MDTQDLETREGQGLGNVNLGDNVAFSSGKERFWLQQTGLGQVDRPRL